MTRILTFALLVLAVPLAVSQQPQQPGQRPGQPPMGTPPTFPQTLPENRAPGPDQISSVDIQQQLQSSFDKDAIFSGANIQTTVDDNSITLKGTVQDERQHQRALQLAQANAGSRKIVDKLVVRSTT